MEEEEEQEVVVVAVTVSVVVEEERGEGDRGGTGQCICSYCNHHFFNYCTTKLVMTVYEINVLELNLHPTTAH